MHNVHRILYVSHAAEDESSGLLQAFAVARNNNSEIKVLLVYPAVPAGFEAFSELCAEALLERVRAGIASAQERMKLPKDKVKLEIESDCGPRRRRE